MKKNKTVGLALGSGAFRGFAHIGVIRSLEKHNIPINYISGASIGAWVGAYYAIHNNIERLKNDLTANPKQNITAMFDLSWTGGFIGGEKFSAFLERNLSHHNFSALKIPLQIVATDLISGEPYVFKSGDVARAVRASTSVPLVFKPVAYKNRLFVDGGLSNPVPCDLVKKMGADIVIGVNLYNKNEFVDRKFNMPNVVLRSTRIVMHNLAKLGVEDADIVIDPDTSYYVKQGKIMKYFTKEIAEAMIKIGEKATDKMIPKIKALLK